MLGCTRFCHPRAEIREWLRSSHTKRTATKRDRESSRALTSDFFEAGNRSLSPRSRSRSACAPRSGQRSCTSPERRRRRAATIVGPNVPKTKNSEKGKKAQRQHQVTKKEAEATSSHSWQLASAYELKNRFDARLVAMQKWYSFLPLKSAVSPLLFQYWRQYFVVIFGRLLVAFSNDDSLVFFCLHAVVRAELFGVELFRAPSFRVSDGKTAMQAVGRDVACRKGERHGGTANSSSRHIRHGRLFGLCEQWGQICGDLG